MNYIAKLTVCTLSLALLSACGGGGDDSGAKPRTQDEIKSVASAGLVATENMMTRAARVIGTLGSTLVTQSSVGGGSSGPATVSCATAAGGTGTRMSSLTKSATRVGLAPEDVLTVTYSNCATSSSGVVVNGTATVTAKSVIANATAANVDIQFRLDTTGLTLLNGTTANTVAGSIVARLKTVNGDTIQLSYVVPADKVFRSVDGSAGLTMIHGPNGTIAVDGVLSTGRETHRMEGSLTVGATPSGTQLPFLVSTTGMTGSNTGGSFVATSGTLFVKETQQNVATSVTVNGTSATVSGDTNADGSLDLSFPTTWALLFSL